MAFGSTSCLISHDCCSWRWSSCKHATMYRKGARGLWCVVNSGYPYETHHKFFVHYSCLYYCKYSFITQSRKETLIYPYDITWCCIVHQCKFDTICFLTNRIDSQMLIMLWHYFVTIFMKQNIDWNATETSLFRRGRRHVSKRFIHLE